MFSTPCEWSVVYHTHEADIVGIFMVFYYATELRVIHDEASKIHHLGYKEEHYKEKVSMSLSMRETSPQSHKERGERGRRPALSVLCYITIRRGFEICRVREEEESERNFRLVLMEGYLEALSV